MIFVLRTEVYATKLLFDLTTSFFLFARNAHFFSHSCCVRKKWAHLETKSHSILLTVSLLCVCRRFYKTEIATTSEYHFFFWVDVYRADCQYSIQNSSNTYYLFLFVVIHHMEWFLHSSVFVCALWGGISMRIKKDLYNFNW